MALRIAFLALLGLLLTGCATSGQMGHLAEEARRSQPKPENMSPRELERSGDAAVGQDQPHRALMRYTLALEKDPDNPHLLRKATALFAADDRMDRAAGLAQRLLKAEPHDTVGNIVAMADAARAGAWKRAQARIDALPDNSLTDFMTPLLGAWTNAARGDVPGALRGLRVTEKRSDYAHLYHFAAGLVAAWADQPDTAREHFAAVVESDRQLSVGMVRLLMAFYRRHGDDDVVRKLEKAVHGGAASPLMDPALLAEKPGPLVPTARDGMARSLFTLGMVLNARKAHDLALVFGRAAQWTATRDMALPAIMVAEIFENKKRYARANAAYTRVPDGDAGARWVARLRTATNLDKLGRTDEAVALLRDLAAERPDRRRPLVTLGDILRGHERFAAAEKAYTRAIERLDDLSAEDWVLFYARGMVRERQDQWAGAEKDLRKALALNPDQPLALNYLGYTWVDRGTHLERARRMIERAVSQRPEDGYIVDSLGWVLYRLGHHQKAVKHLEKAVTLRPQDAVINDHLGDAYWAVGRKREARFQWRRALSLDPGPKVAERLRDKLADGLDVPEPVKEGG